MTSCVLMISVVFLVFLQQIFISSCENNDSVQFQNHHTPEVEEYNYNVKWFEVPVDHFSFTNNKTFKLRYLVNSTWQQDKNAPIFFYTGNEGDIEVFANNTGFMWEIAPRFKALLIFAEHRYYGESMPFGNKSHDNANLGYLTSQQALADYVDLIEYLRHNLVDMLESPVIVFGGSYGGMLSAWIRMKYPHIVQGAIASSAPILQFTNVTDCQNFARIVSNDFKMAEPQCRESIRKSWQAITEIVSNDEGKKWLSNEWKLCNPLKNETDVKNLKNFLSDLYGNVAMVNYPYENSFLEPLPGNPIKVMCKHLKDSSLTGKPLLEKLYAAISVYTNFTGNLKCLTTSDSTPNLKADVWDYQACTEMVMPMCTNGVEDMFEPESWDLKKFTQECQEKFGVIPQADSVCKQYGCNDLSATTNIVFSNGLLDPWSSGGVLWNLSYSARAILIPEAAHHLDLRNTHEKDPPSVIDARKFHSSSIEQWIEEHRHRHETGNMKNDNIIKQTTLV